MILFGFIINCIGLVLLVAEPLSGVADFGDVVDRSKIRGVPFFVGLFMMLAGCIGLRFLAKRNIGTACPYFTILVIVLTFEIGLAWFMNSTAQQMKDLREDHVAAMKDADLDPPWFSPAYLQRRAMGKIFASFAKRFNDVEDHDCHLLPKAEIMPPTVIDGTTIPGKPEQRWKSSAGGCAKVTEVICEKKQSNSNLMNERCVPNHDLDDDTASPESRQKFVAECNNCLDTYYGRFIKGSKTELKRQGTKYNLTAAWESDASLAWCRCFGRQMESWARHLTGFTVGIVFLIILQFAMIFSSGYMYFCAEPPEDDSDCSDEEGMEMAG